VSDHHIAKYLHQVKRVFIGIAGTLLLLVGAALLLLPGPALPVIFMGLGLLSIEFAWAAALLVKARSYVSHTATELKTGARWWFFWRRLNLPRDPHA
jgi:hypothetical protein